MNNTSSAKKYLSTTALGFGVLIAGNFVGASSAFAACVPNNPGPLDYACTGASSGVNITTPGITSPTLTNSGTIIDVDGVRFESSNAGAPTPIVVTQTGTGSIVGTAGEGVYLFSKTADLKVSGNAALTSITGSGFAIAAQSTSGNIDIRDNTLNGGVLAVTGGTGKININGAGSITTTSGVAITATLLSGGSTGNISIGRGSTISGEDGIVARNNGVGDTVISGGFGITATNGTAILVRSTNANAGLIDIYSTRLGTNINASGAGAAGISAESKGVKRILNGSALNVSGFAGITSIYGSSSIENSGQIGSGAGGPGTLDYGMFVTSGSTGANVQNEANIGSFGDQILSNAIYLENYTTATGALNVGVNNSELFSKLDGIAVHDNSISGGGGIGVDIRAEGSTIVSSAGFAVSADISQATNIDDTVIYLYSGALYGKLGAVSASTIGTGNIDLRNNGRVITDGVGVSTKSTTGITSIRNNDLLLSSGGPAVQSVSNGGGIQIVNTGIMGEALGISPLSAKLAISAVGGEVYISNFGISRSEIIAGRIETGAFDDFFDNQSIWSTNGISDFGSGEDFIRNTGTIAAGDDIPNTQTATVLKNLTYLDNSGTIILQDQAKGDNSNISDTLTVDGNFFGFGAVSVLEVDAFVGGPGSLADQLIINGNSSGKTLIKVNDTNAGVGVANTAGITIVKVNGTASASDFALSGGPINKGLFQYDLSFDAAAKIFELVSAPNAVAYQSPIAASSLEGLWHDTMGAWVDHQSNIRDAVSNDGVVTAVADPAIPGAAEPQRVLWMAVDGLKASHNGSGITSPDYDQKSLFVTGGADFGVINNDSKLMFGVMGGYINSNVDVSASPTAINFTGGSFGVYANYINQGLFINTTAKADLLSMDFSSTAGNASASARSIGLRSDAGYRFDYGNTYLEPMISSATEWTSIDDYVIGGVTVHSGTNNSFRLGAGARVGLKSNMLDASLTARVWDELGTAPSVNIAASTVTAGNFGGIFGEVGGHLNYQLSENIAAFADSSVKFGANDSALQASGGLSFKW